MRPGARLGDIGAAIQAHAEKHGFSVVREFCGHGIGRKFHEEPQVLHYGRAGAGLELEPGMTFTIEPMINAGKPGIRELADGWTIVTKDHSLSAQWEHTVAVTEAGFEVLTKSTGTQAATMTADLRGEVAAGRQALRESYLRRPNPRALLTQHSQLIDRTVRKVWNEIATVRDAALVATGGYGRGELYPVLRHRLAGAAGQGPERSRARDARAIDRRGSGTSAWKSATACAPWKAASRRRRATSPCAPRCSRRAFWPAAAACTAS